ncbi:MAG: translation initiation factor IF-2 [Bacteroidetes bacterium]|nr:translation initiation factor IF-2 [Bacteroidota bacterium]
MGDDSKSIRLSKAAKEFNVGSTTIVEFLHKKGHNIDGGPNTKLSPEMYNLLMAEFQSEKYVKEEASKIGLNYTDHLTLSIEDQRIIDEETEGTGEQKDLFIKSLSFDYEDIGIKTTTTKTPEVPDRRISKEPPAEKAKKEEKIVKEGEPARKKPDDKSDLQPKGKTAVLTPEQLLEIKEDKEKKTKGAVTEKEALKDDTLLGEEKPAAEATRLVDSEIKILGKIDLSTIAKPSKKGKAKSITDEPALQDVSSDKPDITINGEVSEISVKEKPETTTVTPEETKEITDTTVRPETEEKTDTEKKPEDTVIRARAERLTGPTILGTMALPEIKKPDKKKPVASSSDEQLKDKKKKRKRIRKHEGEQVSATGKKAEPLPKQKFKDRRPYRDHLKPEVSEEEIEKQIKETLQRLSSTGKSKAAKYRRLKRETFSKLRQEELDKAELEKKFIKVTEFVTANELATMMNVPVTTIISTCMSLGLFVAINQRLDAETLTLVAEEFGFKVEFVSIEVQEAINQFDEVDHPEDLTWRPPIVTVMGHVDHGKTSLLDYIRHTNVIAGESGGITQHIGAYEVFLENGKSITFLDTPGHEAFTAMRARGAKVTDIVIVVVSADDNVMPQTIEAINHAQAAGVPLVFAINKIDKPNTNPEKIKEQLSKLNILVEDWGGKYQCQEISAKKGTGVNELLDKVLLEAEMLELKANPEKPARGTVIESSLDKGRGYVAKLLVQDGTINISDIVLAGATFGKAKAMYNERKIPIKEAGPSVPILLLGLNGAPQAGDQFNVMKDEHEAKSIANKRLQLQREQGLRTQKHITLDEIGRRIAIGDFKELNIIVKGDVDGSVEALSDSLLKLSTEQVQVNVIHKSVGPVTESDVLLASASDAIVIGFQVRPSVSARKLAEQEQIDIRLYSIIYNAINEIKDAIEGMLSPEIEEKITSNIEVREVFKISKIGTVAGCMMLDGKITRHTKVRVIRNGIVVYTGVLGSLKRFKDDVKEVTSGYECGLNIENYNDIKVGDIIEGYEEIEVKRKL